jgi:hypothetical protein
MEKAKGKRQKAKGERQEGRRRLRSTWRRGSSIRLLPFAFCLLPFAFFLFPLAFCLAEKFHDVPPGGPGGIRIAVQPIADLEEAIVVEATDYKAYVADIDRASGTVSLKGLPPGRYDLLRKFKDKVCEGLSLEPPEGVKPIPKTFRDGVEEVTWMSEDYFNEKQIVRSAGNPGTIKLLVEQVRDKRTLEPDGTEMKGILIRRFDLCELRRTRDIWQVKMNRHLFREERKMGGPGTKLGFYHVPALGGARVGDEVATLPAFDAAKLKAPRPVEASYREKPGGSSKPKRKP